MDPRALEIAEADVNEERQTLEITWGDRHPSVYPLKYLRSRCPCATCRTARSAAEESRSNPFRVIDPKEAATSSVIADVEAVGRYGMRIGWADGHSTGIYTFEYLREICPCDACTAARGEQPESPFVHGIYIPK
jgi:DUF971 family protein